MGLKEAVRTVLKEKYATFSGRASRSEFWWFQLFYYLVGFFCLVIMGLLSLGHNQEEGIPSSVILMMIVSGLLFLGMFLPQISVTVRRFHDRNLSGWWYLGLIVASMIPPISPIIGLAILILVILPGTKGPNKFGLDPLSPQSSAEVFA